MGATRPNMTTVSLGRRPPPGGKSPLLERRPPPGRSRLGRAASRRAIDGAWSIGEYFHLPYGQTSDRWSASHHDQPFARTTTLPTTLETVGIGPHDDPIVGAAGPSRRTAAKPTT